jgi:transcriptional regulator with XRE-family HTH domain
MRIEETVGERIRELRQMHGLSQAQLGDRLPRPWPRQAVSAAEQGRRSFTVAELVDFSAALGVGITDLVGETDGRPSVDYVDRHAAVDALRQMRRRLDNVIDELAVR